MCARTPMRQPWECLIPPLPNDAIGIVLLANYADARRSWRSVEFTSPFPNPHGYTRQIEVV